MKRLLTRANIFGALTIMGVGAGVIAVTSSSSAAPEESSLHRPTVRTVVVEPTDTAAVFTARGVVRDASEARIMPKVSGRVTRLLVDVGTTVRRGQLLAVIDGSELYAQSRVAESGVAAAEEAVKETKEYFAAQIKQAKKARDLAREAYEDAKDGGDREKIAAAKAQYELAKKAYAAAKEGRDVQVDMARGQRDVAQRQLEAARIMAGNTYVRAPFSGVIAQRFAQRGELVSPQFPMFLLVGNSAKQIDLTVSPQQLQAVRVGQQVTVRADDGTEETATISVISPMIDTQTRKGLVRVTLPSDSALPLGTYVDVMVRASDESSSDTAPAPVIPRRALVPMYHDMYVFVVEEGVARRVQVTVDDAPNNRVRIVDGVRAGQHVVVEGQAYLSDGMAVDEVTQ